METSVRKGFSFGLASGIITTLGLMVGLHSSTHSRIAVIGGILAIAIADAFSDAIGMHISEESERKHRPKEIWTATLSTFLSKLFFASTFILPVLIFELKEAIIVSVCWGLTLIISFSFYMAKQQKTKPLPVILEHLLITIIVVMITHYIGDLISSFSPLA
ncbi:MAG: VIT1/CCC1 transporter family protein [Candidatus Aenigmatarchaeota archaeon]